MERSRYSILIKWLFLNLAILGVSIKLSAQLQRHERLELTLGRNESQYDVLSAYDRGIILHRLIDELSPSPQFQLIHLDTAFKQKWSGIIPVDRKFKLGQKAGSASKSYFLFHHREFATINFVLYEVDLDQGVFSRYLIRNYIPFLPTHFATTRVGALIGGYFAGRIPVILFFDFNTLKSKVLPGLFNEQGELIQINCNPDDSFNILIGSKNFDRQKTIWIKNYTAGGDLIQNEMLKPHENSSLLFGRMIMLNQEQQFIAGVYGQRNSEYSRGLFLAHLGQDADQELYYYPFSDLENFFQFMKAKREKRIKERIARKKIKGRKIRFQYRFLVHEFIYHNNEYVLLGEAFYPRYKNTDAGYTFGVGSRGNQTVFDGYQYTHAIIIGFDGSGNLLWDNSFEINDIRSFQLEQFVKMDVQPDQIALLYLYNNKIRSKIIQDNKVLEGKVLNELNQPETESLAHEESGFNKLDYWYNDKFIAYGMQQINPRRLSRSGKQIFFIHKLSYR